MLSISDPTINSDQITFSDQVVIDLKTGCESLAPNVLKVPEIVGILLKSESSVELKKFYEFPAKKNIKLSDLPHYHFFHPLIIRVLHEFHNSTADKRESCLKACIAHIVEGSSETSNGISRAIYSILHLTEGFDELSVLVSDFLDSSCERISYGHTHLRELGVWENKELDYFDEKFKEHILGIRRHRLAGKIILVEALKTILENEPQKTADEIVIKEEPKSVSKTEMKEPSVPQSKKARIMDYFQVLPKEAPAVTDNDCFFMPFHPKPNTRMQIHSRNRRRHPAGYVAKCWNDIESYSVLKLKLLQFSEDYRPAYFGTWSKRSKVVNGRDPFAKDVDQLNYEYDSDEEWQEENDEGESILGSESESEGEEEEADALGSEDSWVVPDGYLSEGEGVGAEDLPKELDPFYDPGLTPRKSAGRAKKIVRDLRIAISGPHFLPLVSQHTLLDPWEKLEAVFCS